MKSLPNSVYDWMKWLVILCLPAFSSLWAGLAKIWDLPYPTEIPATISVICTFLGAILCISTAQYNKEIGDGLDE
jgi:hypothetical protein